MLFSIVVVSLNPGNKLFQTIRSIKNQTFQDYEIVIKDGMSTDGSLDALETTEQMNVIKSKDKSIYDGMNQAIEHVRGQYLLFLNCGDRFFDKNVLENTAKYLQQDENIDIAYGNLYHENLKTPIQSAPVVNGFTCFRNVPCHQTCFYKKTMFAKRAYNIEFKVRGDYEHFLWCFYKEKAKIKHIPVTISFYEGGGYSETPANIKRSKKEHRIITKMYMTPFHRAFYQGILWLTLAPIRKKMADSKHFSKVYQAIKQKIYRLRK